MLAEKTREVVAHVRVVVGDEDASADERTGLRLGTAIRNPVVRRNPAERLLDVRFTGDRGRLKRAFGPGFGRAVGGRRHGVSGR